MTSRWAVTALLPTCACGPALHLDGDWSVALDGAILGLAVDVEGAGSVLVGGDAPAVLRFDADAVATAPIDVPGALFGPMARDDGSVVVVGADFAVGLSPGGAEAWRADLPGTATLPGAVAPDGSVWVAGARDNGTGFVVRLAANGIPFREFTPRHPLDTPLVVDTDGVLYAGTSGLDTTAGEVVSDLRAFSPDGDEQWTVRLHAAPLDVAVTATTVYASTDGGGLVAVDRATGGTRWDVAGVGRWPVVDGEGVVYTSGPDGLFAVDDAGDVLWGVDGDCGAQALAVDGTRYAPCGGSAGSIPSTITGTGQVHQASWRARDAAPVLPAGGIAGPLVDGGAIYLGGSDGSLYRLTGAADLASSGWPAPRGTSASGGLQPGDR